MSIQPTDIDVLDLLPHRQPFIMIDKLTHFDLKSAKTVFVVRDDNLFCFDGIMEEAGLVENIAQTCAARTGFKQIKQQCEDFVPPSLRGTKQSRSVPRHCEERSNPGADDIIPANEAIEKVKIGVIGMINMLEIKRCPFVGEVLETSMDIEEEFFSTTFVRSEVKIGDETIATCRMKLFLTDKTPGENGETGNSNNPEEAGEKRKIDRDE